MLLLSLKAFILLKKTRIVYGSYTNMALLISLYSKYSDALSKLNRPYNSN
jgi:hypothetical protein